MKRFTRLQVVRSLGIALLSLSLATVTILSPSRHGASAGAISRLSDSTGFDSPFGGTGRYEYLAPTEVVDLAERNEPIGRARADEIAAAMNFSTSDVMTNEQYIKFVTGRGVGGDDELAVLLGQSVGLFINNNGMPLYSNVNGEIRASVLSSFGLMVDPVGRLQSLANASSPSKQVNIDLAPGGYMGDWCRANGCADTIRGLYASAYTGEVVFGYLSQQASEPAQLVTNVKDGVSTQIGMSMIPSIWLVNFILLYALNPNYAALMPSNWAGIPAQVSDAIWANGGQVPYVDFAAQLPSYEELLTIFAGTGTPGEPVSGPAIATDLNRPGATAVDSAGNVYIADSGNNLIEKVTPDGILSVIAGGGATSPGSGPGPATDMALSNPRGVAVDSAGNVYIADTGNDFIEEVDFVSGNLYVLAGGGTMTPQESQAATAWKDHFGLGLSIQLNAPEGIAVDSSGIIYIAATGDNVIARLISGIFSVVAGDGTVGVGVSSARTSAVLNEPQGLAIDPDGVVYIADSGNNVLKELGGRIIEPVALRFTG